MHAQLVGLSYRRLFVQDGPKVFYSLFTFQRRYINSLNEERAEFISIFLILTVMFDRF